MLQSRNRKIAKSDEKSKRKTLSAMQAQKERALISSPRVWNPARKPSETQRNPTPAHGGCKVQSVSLTVKERRPTLLIQNISRSKR